MPHFYVVSGTTSGIGKALVELALQDGDHVLAVNRKAARPDGIGYRSFRCDLARPFSEAHAAFKTALLAMLDTQAFESLRVINNASTLGTVGPADQGSPDSLRATMNTNFHSHRELTVAAAEAARQRRLPLSVLSVSTGAATQPFPGWAEYCASKAAFDLWFRCFHRETSSKLKSAVFYPGVVDTRMQESIRGSDPACFQDVAKFQDLKKSGRLRAPEQVARAMIDLMASSGFGSKPAYDVRELVPPSD